MQEVMATLTSGTDSGESDEDLYTALLGNGLAGRLATRKKNYWVKLAWYKIGDRVLYLLYIGHNLRAFPYN